MTLQINVSQENLRKLEQNLYLLSRLENRLQYMSDEVKKDFKEIETCLNNLFEDYNKEKIAEDVAIYQYFEKIQDENGFHTLLSISNVKSVNEVFGNVRAIRYGKREILVNKKKATYMDLWKAANEILAGENHYIYIEDFIPLKTEADVYTVEVGS